MEREWEGEEERNIDISAKKQYTKSIYICAYNSLLIGNYFPVILCVCIYIYIYMCVCVWVCVCVYIYIRRKRERKRERERAVSSHIVTEVFSYLDYTSKDGIGRNFNDVNSKVLPSI